MARHNLIPRADERSSVSSIGSTGTDVVDGNSSSDHASLVLAYLEGIDYPATRSKLITKANENTAPQDVIDLLGHAAETADFRGPQDVIEEYGREVEGAEN